ncbi:MAG: magnesium/cobalt transporter CorA [Planctomycetota bacterium]|jgi:magnesium transporter
MSSRKRKRRRRHSPGTAPGTIVVDPEAVASVIRLVAYGPDGVEEREIDDTQEIAGYLEEWPVTWVNVDGLGDADTIRALGEIFGLHKLALEDVVNVHQRAKVEEYDEQYFVVARIVSLGERLATEQISLFLGPKYVVTFQERSGDCFDPVRERIRRGKGRIRKAGPDYLAYALLDAIVDNCFPVLEVYGERLEELESEIMEHPTTDILARVHRTKRDLISLRRTAWPQRDALNSLTRETTPLISDETRLYLRDCYDHAVQVMDLVESYREIAGGLLDAYLSNVSNRMNEVMKVLTIIATVFIPLTFLAGIYGMNFQSMPELGWTWAYPALLLVMAVVAGIMIWKFHRMGWLGAREPAEEDES